MISKALYTIVVALLLKTVFSGYQVYQASTFTRAKLVNLQGALRNGETSHGNIQRQQTIGLRKVLRAVEANSSGSTRSSIQAFHVANDRVKALFRDATRNFEKAEQRRRNPDSVQYFLTKVQDIIKMTAACHD